ncbi:MAG TPA: CAP domain-containing protein [Nitriliruptorales bacterium]|nr:CAP domain-containing protein [Nitriliruptorales bacterium]
MALSLAVARPAVAAGDPSAETRLVAAANHARAAAGLPSLAVRTDLTQVARGHSARMADQGRLAHNAQLGAEVSGWQRVGENVGRGPSTEAVHDEFMASATHRAVILDAGFTEIGVGIEVRDGLLWVSQVFRQPESAATPTAAAPSTADPAPQGAAAAPRPAPAARQEAAAPRTAQAPTSPAAPRPAVAPTVAPAAAVSAPTPPSTWVRPCVRSVLAVPCTGATGDYAPAWPVTVARTRPPTVRPGARGG